MAFVEGGMCSMWLQFFQRGKDHETWTFGVFNNLLSTNPNGDFSNNQKRTECWNMWFITKLWTLTWRFDMFWPPDGDCYHHGKNYILLSPRSARSLHKVTFGHHLAILNNGVKAQSLPSGKHTENYGTSPCFMGKLTISMAIFNSYVRLPEGTQIYRTY